MSAPSRFLPQNQVIALRYFSRNMEASARTLGQHVCIARGDSKGGSNVIAVGSVIIGLLRKRGWISSVPELYAWQITKAGRDALLTIDGGPAT